MSDLQALLKRADGGPVEPLDAEVPLRTARVRMIRRRAVGVVVLIILAGALIPAVGDVSQERDVVGQIQEGDADPPITELDEPAPAGPQEETPQRVTTRPGSQQRDALLPERPPAEAGPDRGVVPPPASPALSGRLAFTVTDESAVRLEECWDTPCFSTSTRSDIRIMDLGSGRVEMLIPPAQSAERAVWSFDGGRLAYNASGGEGVGSYLYTIRPDGSDRRRIYAAPDQLARRPAWSPDGHRIAFMREPAAHTGQTEEQEIWMVDADGGNPRRVEEIQRRGYPTRPAWSPDGRYLAYSRLWPDRWLYTLDLETGQINSWGSGFQAAWSPDGKRIAVTDGDLIKVLTTEVWGGDIVASISRPGLKLSEPNWSPDGRWIAMAAAAQGGRSSIWVARPDGEDLAQVIEGPDEYYAPSWAR